MAVDLPPWIKASWLKRVRKNLLDWYNSHRRDLPWRATNDAYAIWISEIMLQQTQVATVVPYFARFLKRFPNVESLAIADEEEVLRYWEGLGYYRRAKQMHAAAKIIHQERNGVFPRALEDIQSLPGVGRYTAGAIASFAFKQTAPIVEANTQRLYARLCRLETPLSERSSQAILWSFAQSIVDSSDPCQVNQGLIELGALVCKPKPNCPACPLRSDCPTYRDELQDRIPVPKAPKHYENRIELLALLNDGKGRWLLRRCGTNERWAGLWDFPRFDVTHCVGAHELNSHVDAMCRQRFGRGCVLGEMQFSLQHAVTRFRITLHCHLATWVRSGRLKLKSGSIEWVACEDLEHYPLCSSGRKVFRKLIRRFGGNSIPGM